MKALALALPAILAHICVAASSLRALEVVDEALPNKEGPTRTEEEVTPHFSLWPPPPSTFYQTNCYLRLNSCVHHVDINRNDSVAVSLVCDQYTTEAQVKVPPTYVLNRTDYLRLAVEHQRNMADDFCRICHGQCGANQNNNNSNNNNAEEPQQEVTYTPPGTYAFVPQGTQQVVANPHELPFHYECEACQAECVLRETTSASLFVETAVAYSNCGLINDDTNDTAIYAGPVCESMEMALQLAEARMDFGIFQDATCQALQDSPLVTFVTLEGRSTTGGDLLRHYSTVVERSFSNGMWDSISTAPLSCVETTVSGAGTTMVHNDGPLDIGWCQSVLELAQSCQDEEDWDDETNRPLCSVHVPRTEDLPPDLPIIYNQAPPDPNPVFDLTGASLRYGSCHSHQGNNRPYVSFRMCLGGRDPEKCKADCQDFVMDAETYLEYTATKYYEELESRECEACATFCGETAKDGPPFLDRACDFCGVQDEEEDLDLWCWTRSQLGDRYSATSSGPNCDTCSDECMKVQYMEQNGYVDATRFYACAMIWDNDDDGMIPLFAGPFCDGDRIKIGVFLDEDCLEYDPSKDPENYLKDDQGYQMKLSYAKLKAVTTEMADKPMSCAADTPLSSDPYAAWSMNDVCRTLQLESLSCRNGSFNEDAFMYPQPNTTLIHSFCPNASGNGGELGAGHNTNEEESSSHPSETVPAVGDPTVTEEEPPVLDHAYYDLTASLLEFGVCHDVATGAPPAAQSAAVSVATASAVESPSRARYYAGQYVSFQMCTAGPGAATSCEAEQDCQFYVTSVENYLKHTLRHYESALDLGCAACDNQCSADSVASAETTNTVPFVEKACNLCKYGENCWARDKVWDFYSPTAAVNCNSCPMDCNMMAQMEANGYVSGSEFRRCVMIYDPEDDGMSVLFAGPMCHTGGETAIKIGVFLDEDCTELDTSKNVDDYLMNGDGFPMKVSYVMLKEVTKHTDRKPLSCAVDAPLSNSNISGSFEMNDMCRSLKAESYACRDKRVGRNFLNAAEHPDPENSVLYQSICPIEANYQEWGPASAPDEAGKENPTLVEEGGIHGFKSAALHLAGSALVPLAALSVTAWLATL